MRDSIPTIAAYLFLAGVLLMFASPLAPVRRVVPKPLLLGFCLSLASFALVGIAAVLL